VGPAGIGGHPEDVLGPVFVGVFGIGPGVVAFPSEELGAVFLEGVRDVLEEDEAEDDVLVLSPVTSKGTGDSGRNRDAIRPF